MKNYNVTSCIVCPFCVEENDFDKQRGDTYYFCQLNWRTERTDSYIASYKNDDYNNPLPEELVSKVLDDCPLKEGEIKVKLL